MTDKLYEKEILYKLADAVNNTCKKEYISLDSFFEAFLQALNDEFYSSKNLEYTYDISATDVTIIFDNINYKFNLNKIKLNPHMVLQESLHRLFN